MQKNELTHQNQTGEVHMVDISGKTPMKRTAIAEAYFIAAPATIEKIMAGDVPKGEALATARIAAIQAAKHTDDLIPLCHRLSISGAEVLFHTVHHDRHGPAIRIESSVSTVSGTGVEMEALSAVSVAALTLYDMTKAVDKQLRIEGIQLLSKKKETLT